jgi:hypothetical protein
VPAKAAIPKEAAELFNKALAVFYAWIVDELSEARIEPSIAQLYSIGAACDLVQSFDDPMPANAYELLVSLAAAGAVRAPADRSYASGAICLKALRSKHLASIEMRGRRTGRKESQRGGT